MQMAPPSHKAVRARYVSGARMSPLAMKIMMLRMPAALPMAGSGPGDQGYFHIEGYLKITGRLKEIINRGGEKISPLEVDNVLMEHPAIEQVVTFAVADKMLGEDVAAAVVLAEGASLSEAELNEYANTHLAKFKVPKQVRFLEEIPKGATGKLQRIGLAEKLGL